MALSRKFTLHGPSSLLTANIFPPILLDKNKNYGIGLLNFFGYNTIANVQQGVTSEFSIMQNTIIGIPTGTYDAEAIFSYLEKEIAKIDKSQSLKFNINHNTGRVSVLASFDIDASYDGSVTQLLGFTKRMLKANILHTSDAPANIFNYHSINVECNLTSSDSYVNGIPSNVIYSFCPDVEINYRINQAISPIIYLNVSKKVIDFIEVRVTSEKGALLDFRGENISLILHLIEV